LKKGFIIFSLFVHSVSMFAQWQLDVRLTNNPANSYTSFNNAWCIASSGSVVHIVWEDRRDGNDEIYYKRSIDAGESWEADTRLTNNTAASWNPSVTVSGSVVHVVWRDDRDGNYETYYKRSIDGGVSWGTDTRLTNNSAVSAYPSVTVSGSVVHVVWHDLRDGNNEIYYKRSIDGGVSWEADTRLTNNTNDSSLPSVTVSGSVVHVVWQDFRDGNYELYYKRSIDGGVSWGADTRLTINSSFSERPSVTVSGSVVHVVWQDARDGNYEIYYKRSIDGGVSWGADTRLTINAAESWSPSVTVSGSIVHVVWRDERDGNREIYYKRSLDAGVSWGAEDTRLTNNTSGSSLPSVTVSGSVVHVVWWDSRDGNPEIYYKRDPTGNPIGIININSEIPNQFSLSQNYPNPFNPNTIIRFKIKDSRLTTLKVFDVLGREVSTLVNEQLKPGTYEVDFDGSNYPSGVYFYSLYINGELRDSKKMVLIK